MLVRLLIIVFMFSFCFSHYALANPRRNMTLEQAVEQVKQRNNGRVLSASTRRDNNQRATHNVRILTPRGQVKRYQINGRTGQYVRPANAK
ncbi:MAG: hypothetical protein QM504_14815 [Pseudomonadota bacterium]